MLNNHCHLVTAQLQDSLCDVWGGHRGTGTDSSPSIPRVIPQRSRYFKWQPSARVSQIIWSSLSHVIAATTYQRPGVHLGPLTCPCYTGQRAQIIYYPGSNLVAPYSHSGFRCIFGARNGPQEYWPLHGSQCRNTMTYAHTTSRILPTWDMSLGSLTSYTWDQRLCGITSAILRFSPDSYRLTHDP
jgi:hypothetical protein